jgi:hypothetical protein
MLTVSPIGEEPPVTSSIGEDGFIFDNKEYLAETKRLTKIAAMANNKSGSPLIFIVIWTQNIYE